MLDPNRDHRSYEVAETTGVRAREEAEIYAFVFLLNATNPFLDSMLKKHLF